MGGLAALRTQQGPDRPRFTLWGPTVQSEGPLSSYFFYNIGSIIVKKRDGGNVLKAESIVRPQ